jgi:hypothetical protein
MPYVRTVQTASGATAVQIVYSWHRGSREIEHIGSAHDDPGLELLKAAARRRLAAGQGGRGLGCAPGGGLAWARSRGVPWAGAGSRIFLVVTNRDHGVRTLHPPARHAAIPR